MFIVHVQVRVLPEFIAQFIEATLENASHSIQEPGIARVDFLQLPEDPCRFLLAEAYRTPDAQAQHRTTAHYLKWRDLVAPMMAEPRIPTKYTNLFPSDPAW
jgi:quinol monooxygenase YgiN